MKRDNKYAPKPSAGKPAEGDPTKGNALLKKLFGAKPAADAPATPAAKSASK